MSFFFSDSRADLENALARVDEGRLRGRPGGAVSNAASRRRPLWTRCGIARATPRPALRPPPGPTDLGSALPADVSDDERGRIVDRDFLINSVGKNINRATRALPDSPLRRLRQRSITRTAPSLLRTAVEPTGEKLPVDDAVLLVPSSLPPIAETAPMASANVLQPDD